MADTELNARMKALTDEKESLKAQIADAQQAETDLEEQAARRRQMWDSVMECAAGYTEFDNELVRQVIQKDHGGGCGNHPHPLPRLGCGAGTGSRMNRKGRKEMAIFITGDTHGDFSRLLPAAFHEQRDLTKEGLPHHLWRLRRYLGWRRCGAAVAGLAGDQVLYHAVRQRKP